MRGSGRIRRTSVARKGMLLRKTWFGRRVVAIENPQLLPWDHGNLKVRTCIAGRFGLLLVPRMERPA